MRHKNVQNKAFKYCGKSLCICIAGIAKIRKSLGMVYQDFALFSNMNVMDNLCVAPVKLLGMSKNEAESKALEMLESVGLKSKAYSKIDVLSGGQKQRIAICRCVMMNPKVILFDEPTSALDPRMVGEVLATIRLLAKRGLTMIIVTHEMEFARSISNRVLFLADHTIYEQGAPKEIFDSPKKEKTISFIKQIKHLVFHIDKREVDLMKLNGQIQLFSSKYGLSQNECDRLKICTEELIFLMLNNVYDAEDDSAINIKLEITYSEKDKSCEMILYCEGKRFNPFENIDDDAFSLNNLGVVIIRHKSQKAEYSYNNCYNILKVVF